MKCWRLLVFLPIYFFLFLTTIYSQNASSYEIATWKGFAKAAVSYTWDDNSANHLTVAQPLFDKYGFKATFFVTTDFNPDWEGFKLAVANGHEVASHSMSHADFSQLSEAQRRAEMEGSKSIINGNLQATQCLTFAYPYCNVGADGETDDYFISARTCQGYIEKSSPDNMMQVSSIVCGSEGPIQTTEDFNAKIDEAIPDNGWVVFLLHGIDNEWSFSPVDSEEFDGHLKDLSFKTDEFWVATYAEAVKYILSRDYAVLNEIAASDSEIKFQLTHQMDPNIFNTALTIKRQLPEGWEDVHVSQGTEELDFEIIEEPLGKFIVLEAVPNYGVVTIGNQTMTGVKVSFLEEEEFRIYPNPAADQFQIDFSLINKSKVKVDLKNILGQCIKSIDFGELGAGEHLLQVPVDKSELNSSGLVFVEMLLDGKYMYTKKLQLK